MTGPTPRRVDTQAVALTRAAVSAALALIIVLASFWSITDVITIFFSMFLPLAAWLALGAVALWAFVFALRHRRDGARPWLPFGICVLTTALGVFVPFTTLWLSLNYRLHHADRMRVVSALEHGALPTPHVLESTMVVHLPWATGASSGGGDILVERENGRLVALFFTYRGILRHYSGYMYRSDNSPVPSKVFGDRVQQSRNVEPHWFFVAFY